MTATSEYFNYEYMNENEIDEELKCVICKQPLQSPVSLLSCDHTFCKKCIEKWLERKTTCPTCRQISSNNDEDQNLSPRSILMASYAEINTRIVINQLDRLLVRCLICDQTNIQRGNYSNHEQICPKKIVFCSATDIQCPWQGTRDELSTHFNDCSFEKLRPIIEELKVQVQVVKIKLRGAVRILENKVHFLLKIINNGNFMTEECTMPMNECKYGMADSSNTKRRYICSICNDRIRREQISLHSCSGDCICYTCVNTQYSNGSERSIETATDDSGDDISN